jgi:hypothetical protein
MKIEPEHQKCRMVAITNHAYNRLLKIQMARTMPGHRPTLKQCIEDLVNIGFDLYELENK